MNKELGLNVKLHDLNLSEKQGYVANSVIDIWTETDPSDQALETLNIFHLHVNDTSEEVTFDVSYMHKDEAIDQFLNFKTDVSGRPLKYKIIVKDMSIHKVLYNREGPKSKIHKNQILLDQSAENKKNLAENVEEIPFQEFRIKVGDYLMTRDGIDSVQVQGGETQQKE